MRFFPNKFGTLRLPEEGGYGQDLRGKWLLRAPFSNSRQISPNDVVEHQDGTITVSGFLINGNWWGC